MNALMVIEWTAYFGFLELWVSLAKFKKYVACEVFEAAFGEGSEFLACLISFRVKVVANR